jgi:hypothetical protein
MSQVEPLFSRRAHVVITGTAIRAKASWPFGRIELDREAITVSTGMVTVRIPYPEVDSLHFTWFDVAVNHHSPGKPDNIRISGWGLKRALRHAVAMESLPVVTD